MVTSLLLITLAICLLLAAAAHYSLPAADHHLLCLLLPAAAHHSLCLLLAAAAKLLGPDPLLRGTLRNSQTKGSAGLFLSETGEEPSQSEFLRVLP